MAAITVSLAGHSASAAHSPHSATPSGANPPGAGAAAAMKPQVSASVAPARVASSTGRATCCTALRRQPRRSPSATLSVPAPSLCSQ